MDKVINELSVLAGVPVPTEDDVSNEHIWVVEKKGDLFGCPSGDSLAHCVSRDLKMGKGIAVEFKKRFAHVDDLLDQDRQV